MKTKNLMLGAVASVIAVGAAFASTLVVPQFVKIGSVPPSSNCKAIKEADCGATGQRLCEVRIQSTGIAYPAYLTSACTNQITTNFQEAVPGEFK